MIRIVYVPLLFLKKIVFEIKKYKLRENDEWCCYCEYKLK
jgi:hypothetical protein